MNESYYSVSIFNKYSKKELENNNKTPFIDLYRKKKKWLKKYENEFTENIRILFTLFTY